jgi:selenoprotein W-related protein
MYSVYESTEGSSLAAETDRHELEIEFCVPCDFRSQAFGLAREVMDSWADRLSSVRLVPSAGGRFEVSLDGTLIFSKADLDRHAEPGEIAGLIRDRLGPPTSSLFA